MSRAASSSFLLILHGKMPIFRLFLLLICKSAWSDSSGTQIDTDHKAAIDQCPVIRGGKSHERDRVDQK